MGCWHGNSTWRALAEGRAEAGGAGRGPAGVKARADDFGGGLPGGRFSGLFPGFVGPEAQNQTLVEPDAPPALLARKGGPTCVP